MKEKAGLVRKYVKSLSMLFLQGQVGPQVAACCLTLLGESPVLRQVS